MAVSATVIASRDAAPSLLERVADVVKQAMIEGELELARRLLEAVMPRPGGVVALEAERLRRTRP